MTDRVFFYVCCPVRPRVVPAKLATGAVYVTGPFLQYGKWRVVYCTTREDWWRHNWGVDSAAEFKEYGAWACGLCDHSGEEVGPNDPRGVRRSERLQWKEFLSRYMLTKGVD